jgi:hypothetical protein
MNKLRLIIRILLCNNYLLLTETATGCVIDSNLDPLQVEAILFPFTENDTLDEELQMSVNEAQQIIDNKF